MDLLSRSTEFLNDKLSSAEPTTLAAAVFAASAVLPTGYLRLKTHVAKLSEANNDPAIRSKRSLLHEKFSLSKVPADIDYIVIGSGMGGLSCAAILARLGRRVLVLEQHHDTAGGGTHMFDLKGFRFDSGLHYTVPWSQPLFALTCLKRPSECLPMDLMLEEDDTIDKIYIAPPETEGRDNEQQPFRMKYRETHIQQLYEMFPHEKEGLDKYLEVSTNSMHFVKALFLSKLLPKWLQPLYWKLVPSSITSPVKETAKELLPKLIKDKRLIALLSSMWIDTGARPDRASFMLTACVFRGITMEGGCYPRGGSTEMAKELVTVIESNGGKVLIRADVDKLLFDDATQRICGVRLRDGKEIRSKRGVVSATGYLSTMNNLVPDEVAANFGVARSLPIEQSAGFVMANIGIDLPPSEIGATKANTWHIPVDGEGDAFGPLEEFFRDPLRDGCPTPAFITFPSLKDTTHSDHSKTCCQMLLMAEYDWFNKFLAKDAAANPYYVERSSDRLEGYAACKEMWKQRCLDIFLKYFPKARGHIAVADISTPLSIEYYLRAAHGAAVGLDVSPLRFADESVRAELDPISKIPGLALTGQDVALCGVTLCQLAGVITAFRLEGVMAAAKIVLQSIILGDKK